MSVKKHWHGCHGSHQCFLQTLCLTARDMCVCCPRAGYICMSLFRGPLQHASCKDVHLRLREHSHSSAFVTVQNNKQEKQCTYNVTMRCICTTIVTAENIKCWEIIIERVSYIGPSGTELNPICHLLALLEAYGNL